MHTQPESNIVGKKNLKKKKTSQVVFTWGQDGLQNHTEGDTMKNIVKTILSSLEM